MKRMITCLILLLLFAPATTQAIDQLDFGLVPQAGYTLFFGRVGELVSPDISYGVDFVYGILPWIALDLDLLYSEHQQTDSEQVGQLQFNHLQTALGPRFCYNNPYVVPYVTLAIGGNFFRWENRTVSETNEYDGQGMAGYLTLGVDFFVADAVTLGLAGKSALTRSDFEFVTNKDGAESVSAYALLSALVRFTIIF